MFHVCEVPLKIRMYERCAQVIIANQKLVTIQVHVLQSRTVNSGQ